MREPRPLAANRRPRHNPAATYVTCVFAASEITTLTVLAINGGGATVYADKSSVTQAPGIGWRAVCVYPTCSAYLCRKRSIIELLVPSAQCVCVRARAHTATQPRRHTSPHTHGQTHRATHSQHTQPHTVTYSTPAQSACVHSTQTSGAGSGDMTGGVFTQRSNRDSVGLSPVTVDATTTDFGAEPVLGTAIKSMTSG